MSRISRWREFPKATILAAVLVLIPAILFVLRPDCVFGENEMLASALLMTITMLGVGLFMVLTYMVERRKKYELVTLVFAIFLILFFATIAISMFSDALR